MNEFNLNNECPEREKNASVVRRLASLGIIGSQFRATPQYNSAVIVSERFQGDPQTYPPWCLERRFISRMPDPEDWRLLA